MIFIAYSVKINGGSIGVRVQKCKRLWTDALTDICTDWHQFQKQPSPGSAVFPCLISKRLAEVFQS